MPNRLRVSIKWRLTCLFVGTAVTALTAQPLPQYSSQQRVQQLHLQQELTTVDAQNYQRASAEARRLNRPLEQRRANGTTLMLRGISERGELLYDATYSATRAAQTTQQGRTSRTRQVSRDRLARGVPKP